MIAILLLFNSFIFLILSLLHFTWAIGSDWGFDAALPRDAKNQRLFTPRKIDSFLVGIGLLLMGLYYLLWGEFLPIPIPNWMLQSGIWLISAIFFLRAIGDFRYVGFFKKVKNTKFATMDSRFYSPLCLWLALSGLLLIFLR